MIIKRSDIKGKFYKDKALTEPLFYGQLQYDENMWKIKILDFEIPKDRLQFGGLTLYTMISDGDNKVPCSFFNCTTSFQDFIAFSSYTINHNFDCYYEALRILSNRLKMMIKYLFYKEIGLEEFYTIQ